MTSYDISCMEPTLKRFSNRIKEHPYGKQILYLIPVVYIFFLLYLLNLFKIIKNYKYN